MLSIEDIKTIISSPEKENISLELKSVRKLIGKDKPETSKKRGELAQEIVAMGNRLGGKIIIGLNEDGKFDGYFPYRIETLELNADELKESIMQICYDSISPRIEITTQFLNCPDAGDLLVLYIPKKINIPFAFIPDKRNYEIYNRIYYIRTSHGRRLVSDSQLEWLFRQNEDPEINSQLRVMIDMDKEYKVINKVSPWAYFQINNYLEGFSDEERLRLFKDNEMLGLFFIQLLPYWMIKSVFWNFSSNWNMKITRGYDRIAFGYPMNNKVESKEIVVSKIDFIGERILDKLPWDFNIILEKLIEGKFHIPPNSDFIIKYPKGEKSSTILIKNPHFEFTIQFNLLSWGAGLNHLSPDYEIITTRYQDEGQAYLQKNFRHIDGACYFKAKFDFPEYDLDSFQQYYDYAKTIKELLDDTWNFELFRQKFPPKEIAIIDHKLDEILKLLKKE